MFLEIISTIPTTEPTSPMMETGSIFRDNVVWNNSIVVVRSLYEIHHGGGTPHHAELLVEAMLTQGRLLEEPLFACNGPSYWRQSYTTNMPLQPVNKAIILNLSCSPTTNIRAIYSYPQVLH